MAVTAPATAAIVLYNQGASNSQLQGGSRVVPAIVLGVSGLVVSLKAFAPEGDAVFAGVAHTSTAAAGSHSWSWTAASGNSNA